MVMVKGRVIETPALDAMTQAREPQPGTLTRFLDWLRLHSIRLVALDERGNEAAVASVTLRTLAQEVIEDGETAGSQELGEILEVWTVKHELGLCYDFGRRSPWPKIAYVNVWGDERAEVLPGGYYPCTKSTERLLAEFYGIDLDAAEQEKRAILDALRS